MNINSVSDSLVNDWISSQMGTERDNAALFVSIAKMLDSDKATSLISYLTARISSNTTIADGLTAQADATSSALSADSTVCSSAITSIEGS